MMSKNPHAVALGRLGGLASRGVTSAAKKKAARENGKRGGRPAMPGFLKVYARLYRQAAGNRKAVTGNVYAEALRSAGITAPSDWLAAVKLLADRLDMRRLQGKRR